jgi:hypothetical protein
MHKFLARTAACALLLTAFAAQARDSFDGDRLIVKPYKGDTFETGEYRFGKAELYGYIGDLKDSKHIKGMLLRDGGKASDEQKHIIATIAQSQQIDAVIELDGKQQPLVDPKPAAAAAPEAIAAPAVTPATP